MKLERERRGMYGADVNGNRDHKVSKEEFINYYIPQGLTHEVNLISYTEPRSVPLIGFISREEI